MSEIKSLGLNILLLQLAEIFFNMMPFIPVVMPFYRDHIGLDFQDFLIGEAVFAVVVVAFEVPSGWISDVWRRKYVLFLSCLFMSLGFIVFLIATNLFWAILAQAIMGIAISLKSGTDSALLYDTLICEERTEEYSKLEGRIKGFGLYSVATGSLAGGFLYEINYLLPVAVSTITGLVAAIICLFLQEPPRYKTAVQHHPVKDMLITMRYALHGHVIVGLIIMFAAVLFSSTKLIMWSQQPYYMALNVPEVMFGVLAAVGYALGGLASHTNHFFEKILSNIGMILECWIAAILICLAAAFVMNNAGIVLLMFGGTFLFGAASPRIKNAINKRVDSDRRATILSTSNLMTELIFVPLSLFIGIASSHYGISGALNFIALWLLISGLLLVIWGKIKLRGCL